MGMSHSDVVDRFFRGESSKGSRMFTDGRTIYSYGEHFPIATKLKGGGFLYNDDSYSSSTSGHQSRVRCGFPTGAKVYKCTTSEIKQAVRHPYEPVILTKFKPYTTMDQVFDALHDVVQKEDMSKIPIQRWRERIEDDITISKIRGEINSGFRTGTGAHLKDLHHFRREEGVKMIIKLLGDEDEGVVQSALSSLMSYMPYLRDKLLEKVDKVLKSKTPGLLKDGLRYVGSINSRYLGRRSDSGSVSIMMYQNEENEIFFIKRVTSGYGYNETRLRTFTAESVNMEDMMVGKMEKEKGLLETTCTLDEKTL